MPTNRKTSTSKITRKNPGVTPAPVTGLNRLKSVIQSLNGDEFMKQDVFRFVSGILLLGISIFMLISFVSNIFTGQADQGGVEADNLLNAANYGGWLGAHLSYYFMNDCFGIASVFIPLFLLLAGVKLMGAYQVRLWKWFLNCAILMIWLSLFLSLTTYLLPDSLLVHFSFPLGGGHGNYIRDWLCNTMGLISTWIVVIISAIFYLLYLTSETMNVIRRMMHPQDYIKIKGIKKSHIPQQKEEDLTADETDPFISDETTVSDASEEVEETEDDGIAEYAIEHIDTDKHAITLDFNEQSLGEESEEQVPVAGKPNAQDSSVADGNASTPFDVVIGAESNRAKGKTVEEVKAMEPYDPRKDLEFYKYPLITLLQDSTAKNIPVDKDEQNMNRDRIVTVLRNFGVEISSIRATVGPAITLYEVTPAPGVRINRIRNLEDDIALSLSALGIRIIAPIPGKGTIGIEVPNKNPQIVTMKSIIDTDKFQDSTYDLPIALGRTITNDVFIVDLAKMPHLLVAGATGQGKSVGLNAIITSLLYKKHPSELKFVLVDPKKVEFSIYAPIEKHFLAKIPDEAEDSIITDVTKVVQTLKSICQLMDHRYDLLKKAKVRNIKEYNAKFKSRMLNPNNGHEFMPYIVVIIDEFGDLIMTAGKEVELPIARIAQLARAVGIHMVLATQRPTTNIITGTIKANFPARMAFKVMSQIDSRTILDQSGANQLIGKGDMLFLAGNTPVRVQCAFVQTSEVEAINEYICHQQGYLSAFELPEPIMEGDSSTISDFDAESLDPLFEEAARLIVAVQQGSTSLIQRKFAIGYNRAGRLMDQLEKMGIVGQVRGSKPREVLVNDEIELESKLSSLRN